MQSPRVLLVVTSADRMGKSPTGSWLEEVAAPYYAFIDAKCEVTIASPRGGNAPMDPTSLEEIHRTGATGRFDADAKAQQAITHTEKLSSVDITQFDAVFFAGGHGTMVDFASDATVKATVEYFYNAAKPISAVCHGPACFVNATKINGEPLIAGHHFTCFTDVEEAAAGATQNVPFSLESKLTEQSGIMRAASAFAPYVAIEGHLVTGQNPASAIPVAEAVIRHLRAREQGLFAA